MISAYRLLIKLLASIASRRRNLEDACKFPITIINYVSCWTTKASYPTQYARAYIFEVEIAKDTFAPKKEVFECLGSPEFKVHR